MLRNAILANMKINFISSLVLEICCFSCLCVLDTKAEVSGQSYIPKVGKTHSLASRSENSDSGLSSVNSVKLGALERRLIKRGQPWTPEETQLLLDLREQQLPWSEIHEHFPDRTWQALAGKYYRTTRDLPTRGVKSKLWTNKERELLLKLVGTNTSWEDIAKNLPGRTTEATKGQYYYLNTDFSAPEEFKRRWTAEEDELIQNLTKAGVPWTESVTLFNNRSIAALRQRSLKFTSPKFVLGGFTSKEDDLIVEALELGLSLDEISQLLERTIRGIRKRIKKLQQLNRIDVVVPQMAGRRKYSDEELELIREMTDKGMSWEIIATNYFPGRSGSSIRKAYRRYQEEN